MAERNFKVYKKVSDRDGKPDYKRLADYDEDLDAEIAKKYAEGRKECRFTFKSPAGVGKATGTKRQYTLDLETLRWTRNNHREEGILELVSKELRLSRFIALKALETFDVAQPAAKLCHSSSPMKVHLGPADSPDCSRSPGWLLPSQVAEAVFRDAVEISCQDDRACVHDDRPYCLPLPSPYHASEAKIDESFLQDADCMSPHLICLDSPRPRPRKSYCDADICTPPKELQAAEESLLKDFESVLKESEVLCCTTPGANRSIAEAIAAYPRARDDKCDSSSDVTCNEAAVQHVRVRASKEGSKVDWAVDRRKLEGKDKRITSGHFDVCNGRFLFVIAAEPMGDRRGQGHFRKSRGSGSLLLKYLGPSASAPMLSLRVSVGNGENAQESRWFDHDFASSITCSCFSMNFSSVLNQDSSLRLSLEVKPLGELTEH